MPTKIKKFCPFFKAFNILQFENLTIKSGFHISYCDLSFIQKLRPGYPTHVIQVNTRLKKNHEVIPQNSILKISS